MSLDYLNRAWCVPVVHTDLYNLCEIDPCQSFSHQLKSDTNMAIVKKHLHNKERNKDRKTAIKNRLNLD